MSHLYLLGVVLNGPYGRHGLHYGIPLPILEIDALPKKRVKQYSTVYSV